ncbi:pyridoxamine 5'-phosphate oxidase family protein [Skermanella mucosa]|uniref:MSMEG_1061 family FMN-dependent PPOX-type flavoprotein n=1 Tax=Skermanella mucosa TaxID=1789672 RepID=UPI00192ADC3C|nr:MSMEG_1061 family FMN-dependent PPOX-type flavoprotein [Skermanella mucosa]UEM19669.1 pyridoxamine 5'-phosphate oxidase family protein [Skermanella mucosa]
MDHHPTDWFDDAHGIHGVEALAARYPTPHEKVVGKQIDRLDGHSRTLIAASPFLVLATTGAFGLDCSPRGGTPGFVQVHDDHTLLLADWPGNNRLDSLRNIVQNPAVGMVFLLPGMGEVFRVNGRARLSAHPGLLSRLAEGGKQPRSAIVVTVTEAFIHCPRAIAVADLWNPEKHVDLSALPSARTVFEAHVALSSRKVRA